MKPSKKISFWIRASNAIDWINQYGVVVVALFLLVATSLWMIALDGIWYLRLPKALSNALLSRDVDKNSHQLIQFGLYVTQVVIPVFASGTILTRLFNERIHPYLKRKKVKNSSDHHVIISYGGFGQALARALSHADQRNSPSQIVALDKRQFDEPDLTVLMYDALQADIIHETNLHSARCVYLLLPDERNNLALLDKIRCLDVERPQLKVYIRTQSHAMQRLLMDRVGIGALNQQGLDIRSSNPYDVAARGIVNFYAPDLYAPTDRTGPVSQVVMVMGTSEMAKALVLRFARIGIYSPKGKLKLIWVGEGTAEAFSELKRHYPALATDFSEVDYWRADRHTSEAYFNSVLPPLVLSVVNESVAEAIRKGTLLGMNEPVLPAAIYVCYDSNILNLAEARDLQATLAKDHAIVHAAENNRSKRLILAVQSGSVLGIAKDVHLPFLSSLPYQIEEVSLDEIFAKTIAEDRADELAKGFHAVYAKSNAIDKEWARLRFFLKESNRDVADHLAIKARYSGIDAGTVADCVFKGKTTILEADRLLMEKNHESLAIMEMRRYRAFMFMNGFTHGIRSKQYRIDHERDGKDLDRCLRINGTLLDESLSQIERAKDDDIVDYSMKAIAKMHSYG